MDDDPAVVTVRRATGEDVAELVALAVASYGGDPQAWEQRLAAPLAAGELVLVAEDGAGSVVGYVRAGRRVPAAPADPAPAGWWLTGLVVAAGARRRGVARRLLADALAHRPHGEPAWSTAGAENAASLALHRSAGFVEVLRAPQLLGEAFGGGEGVLLRSDP